MLTNRMKQIIRQPLIEELSNNWNEWITSTKREDTTDKVDLKIINDPEPCSCFRKEEQVFAKEYLESLTTDRIIELFQYLRRI